MTTLTGHATAEATRRYCDARAGHARPAVGGLHLSSIGLGTGGLTPSADPDTVLGYARAVRLALTGGINVLDTAVSYGRGFSEQLVGAVLGSLVAEGEVTRSEVVVVTKGGYLTTPVEEYRRTYVDTGRCRADDLVAGGHCMAPEFLADQLDLSRTNLDLDTIDAYLLHNPEDQLAARGPELFADRLRPAFEALEAAVGSGRIRYYGVATAEGLRADGEREFHGLDVLLSCARSVAGEGHHLRVLELPVNLRQREALTARNHTVGTRPATLLEAATDAGLTVLASMAIARGKLPPLPEELVRACPDQPAEMAALQFTRSVPGVDVALIGTRRAEHVRQALRLAATDRLDLAPTQPEVGLRA